MHTEGTGGQRWHLDFFAGSCFDGPLPPTPLLLQRRQRAATWGSRARTLIGLPLGRGTLFLGLGTFLGFSHCFMTSVLELP